MGIAMLFLAGLIGFPGVGNGTPEAWSDPFCVPLMAAKTLPVGTVCVEARGDSLSVSYRAEGGWLLSETHLTFAASRDGFPLAGGRQPILGQFLRLRAHQPPVEEVRYAVAGPEAGVDSSGQVFIAAHATVTRGAEEQGAWATGIPFTAEGSPAAYFSYRKPTASLPGS